MTYAAERPRSVDTAEAPERLTAHEMDHAGQDQSKAQREAGRQRDADIRLPCGVSKAVLLLTAGEGSPKNEADEEENGDTSGKPKHF